MIDTTKCIAAIYSDSWGMHQCSHKAVVGQYCRQHDPAAIAERSKERAVKWEAKYQESKRRACLNSAAPAMLSVLRETEHYLRNRPSNAEDQLLALVRSVIEQAGGQSK